MPRRHVTRVAGVVAGRAAVGLRALPPVERLRTRLAQLEAADAEHQQTMRQQQQRIRTLRQRVEALEAEVQEGRRLNKRVAEMTDLVSEVLLPATHRDDDRLQEQLQRFQQSL